MTGGDGLTEYRLGAASETFGEQIRFRISVLLIHARKAGGREWCLPEHELP